MTRCAAATEELPSGKFDGSTDGCEEGKTEAGLDGSFANLMQRLTRRPGEKNGGRREAHPEPRRELNAIGARGERGEKSTDAHGDRISAPIAEPNIWLPEGKRIGADKTDLRADRVRLSAQGMQLSYDEALRLNRRRREPEDLNFELPSGGNGKAELAAKLTASAPELNRPSAVEPELYQSQFVDAAVDQDAPDSIELPEQELVDLIAIAQPADLPPATPAPQHPVETVAEDAPPPQFRPTRPAAIPFPRAGSQLRNLASAGHSRPDSRSWGKPTRRAVIAESEIASEVEGKRTSVSVRVSEEEASLLRIRASESGLTVSAYLRSCVFDAELLRDQVKQALAEMRTAASQADFQREAAGQQAPRASVGARWPRMLLKSAAFVLAPWLHLRHGA